MGFVNDTATWGIFDAIKSVRIEEHVVDAITSLVKTAGLENEVDLVEGVRTNLFFTNEEEAEARDEYEAAKVAGVDVSTVEWLSQSEVEKVRQSIAAIISPWRSPNYPRRHTERTILRCASRETRYGLSSS